MTTVMIRTRYTTRPGSNVGTYRATGGGRSFTAPARLDIEAREREEIAARALASILSGTEPADVREWARRASAPTESAGILFANAHWARNKPDYVAPYVVDAVRQAAIGNGATVWAVKL